MKLKIFGGSDDPCTFDECPPQKIMGTESNFGNVN